MSDSDEMCARCGLAVYRVGSRGTWKHAAGSNATSCGKRPHVVDRETYEAERDEDARAALIAMGRMFE